MVHQRVGTKMNEKAVKEHFDWRVLKVINSHS